MGHTRSIRTCLAAILVVGCGAGGTSKGGAGGRDGSASGGSGGGAGSGGRTTGSGGVSGSAGATTPGGAAGSGGASSVGSGGRVGAGGIAGSAEGGATGAGGRLGTAGQPGAGAGGRGQGGETGSGRSFFLGADITNAQSASAAAQDSLLQLMKMHGFNAVRARTFVDPKAVDGYDKANGYADLVHTIAWGKKVKAAGMAYLVDFHYSDNWADPGKQCVPVAWQGLTTIDALATAVHDYTKDAIMQLVAGDARPEMVQIGNEITPGMLLHRCDSGGQPTGNNPITGSTSNWKNLGALLKAGVKGVKDVDPTILIMLHIDRGGDKPTDRAGAALETSITWITNAMDQGVPFDVFGESCYQRYQGDPSSAMATMTSWTSTFTGLATRFPGLELVAAEYGPMQREVNDVLFGLPDRQGLGTFNWEPDTLGDWNSGHVLFTRSGNTYTAQPDLALYDQMKADYASRL